MGTRSGAIAQRLPPSDEAAVDARKREQTAEYIADMVGDLAAMALTHGLETLAYLLDMARIEAENVTAPDQADRKKDDR